MLSSTAPLHASAGSRRRCLGGRRAADAQPQPADSLPMLASPTGPLDALGSAAPSWAELRSAHATALAASLGSGNTALAARLVAVSRLDEETAFGVMDDGCVVGVYSDAFDGTLEPCGALIDAHVRLLADCLLTGSAARTTAGYSALASLPPMAARQHSAAGAAVGAAALLKLREDSELLVSLLATAEEGDKAKEAAEEVAAGRALVDAVDMVLGALPAPSE